MLLPYVSSTGGEGECQRSWFDNEGRLLMRCNWIVFGWISTK